MISKEDIINYEIHAFRRYSELIDVDDKVGISIKKAAIDAFYRPYTKKISEKELDTIVYALRPIVDDAIKNEFNDIKRCFDDIVKKFNEIVLEKPEGYRMIKLRDDFENYKGQGRAFKLASMIFKYLYCFKEIRDKFGKKFDECYLPLDQFTLNWYTRQFEGEDFKNKSEIKEKDRAWSNFDRTLYNAIQKDVQDILDKGYCYKYKFLEDIIECYPNTRLELEFLIWEEEKRIVKLKKVMERKN